MHDFSYHRARDLADADAKFAAAEDPQFLAGSMTLLPALKLRLAAPSDLIDLADVPGLKGIQREGSDIVIGAMTCHADVAASNIVAQAIPALAILAGGIGDPAVRHRGTIGGSVANADPAADYPAAVVGLDATIETNQRLITADNFFTGLFEIALESGEIITAVRFKIPDCAGYMKFRHPASGYAVVGVMVAKFGDSVRVAVTGAGPSVFRVPKMEAALQRKFAPASVADVKVDPADLLGDMHCSAEYRAHLVTVFAKRAVTAAIGG